MSKKLKDIEMQDWIILRLVVLSSIFYVDVADHLRALTYLNRKYGYKTMGKAVDILIKEKCDD